MKLVQKIKEKKNQLLVSAGTATTAFAIPTIAHASEGGALSINFDVTKMFTWAQTIIDALTPVLYVTLGISLGFLIIRSLRSAF